MSQLFQDLRQSVRLMRHRPGFTAVIVLSIALGVGANTAIFSIANMLLLRPLPFPDDQELMRVRCLMHQEGREPRRISISEFNIGALRDQATTMEEVAGWLYQTYNLVGSEQPVQVWGATTTANALQVMGVEPIMGRFILPEEDQPSAAAKVMVISYVLWQNQFGGDPDIIGKVVKLNDDPHTVIGVMPAFFEYPYKSKVWIPLGLNPSRSIRANWLHSVARLKEGVTREQAMEELDLIAARLEQEYPDTHTGWSFILTPLREDLTSDLHPQRVVLLLMAGAGFLVLIACANVANMLLSRSLEQSGEVAIRAALGISRGRLIRELITQGVVLALMGGALGILVGYWTVQPLIALHPSEDLNRIFLEVKLDHRVLGFTLLLSVAVGVLFSLVPALRASRPNLQSLLMEGSRTTPSRSGRLLLKVVVVLEVMAAVVLLVGGGLMFRSLQSLRQIDPGFETDQMLVLRITPSEIRYPGHRERIDYLEGILTRVRGIPGVVSAGYNSLYPHRTMVILVPMLPEGRPESDPNATIPTNIRSVSPDLVETMKMRLLGGRTFTEQDRAGNEPVMIVSKTLARSAWPDEDPLDRRIRYALPGYQFPWMRVVGVVDDVLDNGEIESTAYVAYPQMPSPAEFMDIVVRTDPPPMTLLPPIREAIWSINPEQAIADIATADALLAGEFWEERSSAFLMGMFATVGLLLTIVGLYGIQSYSVLQQRHEMGVRMVFGARPRDVVLAALGRGMLLAGIGVVVGLIFAALLTRFLTTMLHEVSPLDPLTFVGIAVVTLIVALAANYLPARRATRVDPVDVIRYQ